MKTSEDELQILISYELTSQKELYYLNYYVYYQLIQSYLGLTEWDLGGAERRYGRI